MNAFFHKHKRRKLAWKSPDGMTKNKIDSILRDNPGIVQDVRYSGRFGAVPIG